MIRLSLSRVFIMLVSLCLIGVASATAHAQSGTVFTVKDVMVDVTAENAAKAREQAFTQAQQKAFDILVGRLASTTQATAVKTPDAMTISSLVQNFELTQERLSSVRYIGTYTFRFKEDAVKKYIAGQGVAYTDVASRPVLVLPFYQYGARTILWDTANPWLGAWQNSRSHGGLVPVITPMGDALDISDISGHDAVTFNADNMAALVARYGAGEAIVMVAVPAWEATWDESGNTGRDPDSLSVNLYRTDRGRADFARRITVTPADAATGQSIFDAAVTQVRTILQDAWKQQTMASAEQQNSIQARVRFANMQDWLLIRQSLSRVQGVDEIKIKSIKTDEAIVEIVFKGTSRRLRLSLDQADLALSAPQDQSSYDPAISYSYGYDYDRHYGGTPPTPMAQPVYELQRKFMR